MDLASRAIREGQCDMAIVGGTNGLLLPEATVSYSHMVLPKNVFHLDAINSLRKSHSYYISSLHLDYTISTINAMHFYLGGSV